MNRIKHINMAPYEVTYVDLRDPLPREHHKELYVLDMGAVSAAQRLGIVLSNYIKEKYAYHGFHVVELKKLERVTAYVDITELYQRTVQPQEVEP